MVPFCSLIVLAHLIFLYEGSVASPSPSPVPAPMNFEGGFYKGGSSRSRGGNESSNRSQEARQSRRRNQASQSGMSYQEFDQRTGLSSLQIPELPPVYRDRYGDIPYSSTFDDETKSPPGAISPSSARMYATVQAEEARKAFNASLAEPQTARPHGIDGQTNPRGSRGSKKSSRRRISNNYAPSFGASSQHYDEYNEGEGSSHHDPSVYERFARDDLQQGMPDFTGLSLSGSPPEHRRRPHGESSSSSRRSQINMGHFEANLFQPPQGPGGYLEAFDMQHSSNIHDRLNTTHSDRRMTKEFSFNNSMIVEDDRMNALTWASRATEYKKALLEKINALRGVPYEEADEILSEVLTFGMEVSLNQGNHDAINYVLDSIFPDYLLSPAWTVGFQNDMAENFLNKFVRFSGIPKDYARRYLIRSGLRPETAKLFLVCSSSNLKMYAKISAIIMGKDFKEQGADVDVYSGGESWRWKLNHEEAKKVIKLLLRHDNNREGSAFNREEALRKLQQDKIWPGFGLALLRCRKNENYPYLRRWVLDDNVPDHIPYVG